MIVLLIILTFLAIYLGKKMIDEKFENKNSQTKVGRTGDDDQIYFDDETWLDVDPALRNTPSFRLKPGRKVKVTITYLED